MVVSLQKRAPAWRDRWLEHSLQTSRTTNIELFQRGLTYNCPLWEEDAKIRRVNQQGRQSGVPQVLVMLVLCLQNNWADCGAGFQPAAAFRRLSEEMHIVYSFPGHNTRESRDETRVFVFPCAIRGGSRGAGTASFDERNRLAMVPSGEI